MKFACAQKNGFLNFLISILWSTNIGGVQMRIPDGDHLPRQLLKKQAIFSYLNRKGIDIRGIQHPFRDLSVLEVEGCLVI